MMYGYFSDKRILEGIKKGDLKVYEYLDNRYRRQILKHVKKSKTSNPKEDAEDLFQNTMIEVIRVVQEGRYKEQYKFKGFFESVYEKQWLRILRIRKREPLSDYEAVIKLVNHKDTTFKDLDWIYEYIDLLGEDCKEIFTLGLQGFNDKEIAEELGISHSAARKRRSRCSEKLRELIEKE